MKTSTRVAIIGGGVVGASVLYHLTKMGWSDVTLVERSELTSGSTWHAAGGFHTLDGDTNMAALQGYTIKLYKELEAITGMEITVSNLAMRSISMGEDAQGESSMRAIIDGIEYSVHGLSTDIVAAWAEALLEIVNRASRQSDRRGTREPESNAA